MGQTNHLDLFGSAPALADGGIAYPDEGRVRGKLGRMLETLGAMDGPLGAERVQFYRQVVPQMSLALPEAEPAALWAAFERELRRLDAGARG